MLQTLIGGKQDGRFSPGQSQIEAVVNRVIQMTRQCQGFHLKEGAFNEATSTLPVFANQRFRRWLKCSTITLCRQSSQLGKSLSTPLTRIATTGFLQIHQGLLAQTAVSSTCPQLQEVMQRIRQVADLKGGH